MDKETINLIKAIIDRLSQNCEIYLYTCEKKTMSRLLKFVKSDKNFTDEDVRVVDFLYRSSLLQANKITQYAIIEPCQLSTFKKIYESICKETIQ